MAERIQFDNPPVVEVVCGVLFEELDQPITPYIGLFWGPIRSKFPTVREVAPIIPQIEVSEPQGIVAKIVGVPPTPRIWLMTKNEGELIQVQKDRLLYNWKLGEETPYPGYDVVFVEFEKYLSRFENFIEENDLGELKIRQFELTYVNHIGADKGYPVPGAEAGILVDHVRDETRSRFLPGIERYNWATTYLLPNDHGRLHITAQSALRESEPLMRLDLTARGIGEDRSRNGLKPWFDVAHEWITHGFADITDPETQTSVWGRTT